MWVSAAMTVSYFSTFGVAAENEHLGNFETRRKMVVPSIPLQDQGQSEDSNSGSNLKQGIVEIALFIAIVILLGIIAYATKD